ncbi:hypothetical protein [Cryobacterium arcticum]|uniref:Uncharacterized protein n=1 Tax=Cryobacterium arcticum TaxID=670052 RepID=A0A317ZRI5_9MICO|nr:hypothetical protein [Cryobacterium arcticum]PXA69780.1 hypothetical protein CTB96_09350 [Cryobacterium arcticum]
MTGADPYSTADDDSLTNPAGLYELRARAIPGGRVEVTGFADFQTVRVRVRGASPQGQVSVFGDLPPHGVYGREDDPQVNGVFGRVDFGWLSRFWLTRTSTFDVIDKATPQPGLLAAVDGLDVGVVDSCGTVSLAGVPQLQVIWLGTGDPAGDGWSLDGYGSYTKLVERRLVTVVRQVEWTAIWRDFTVQIAAISEGKAIIFAGKIGEPPPFDAPEVVLGGDRRTIGWSAVVPVAQLSLRGWTLIESPLGVGVVASSVGMLRGRTALMGRVAGPHVAGEEPAPAPGSAIMAKKARGDTVTDEYVLVARSQYYWDWRATVDESEVTDLRQITATTTWCGETYAVEGTNDETAQVYLNRSAVDVTETTPFVYSVRPVERHALPVDSIHW